MVTGSRRHDLVPGHIGMSAPLGRLCSRTAAGGVEMVKQRDEDLS
jgi:hypothetical protein